MNTSLGAQMPLQFALWRRFVRAALSFCLAALLAWLMVAPMLAAHAGPATTGGNQSEFLDPAQAFALHAEVQKDQSLNLRWTIAKGYTLYRDRLQVRVNGQNLMLADHLPVALMHFDKNFNKNVAYYEKSLSLRLGSEVLLTGKSAAPTKGDLLMAVQVQYQGCADSGFCYSPMDQRFALNIAQAGTATAVQDWPVTHVQLATQNASATQVVQVSAQANGSSEPPAIADDQLAQNTLKSGSFWKVGTGFLLFGLLLSLTPCVLPMLPILSSIIVGRGVVKPSQGFALALAYSLGMALVYTGMGVGAGLAGEGLAAVLQKPAVLLTFAALLLLLSLSMFDVYNLQLPAAWQSKMNQLNAKTEGGRLGGVFVMGALSALVVSPCVAAPLAGALIFISQTQNVWLGGWALFSMAMGMSVPLLLAGLSAGTLLPRAGAWMNQVKYLFGLLLVAVAIWTATPALPPPVVLALVGAWLLLAAVYLGLFDAWGQHPSTAQRFGRMMALVLAIAGGVELVGAMSQGQEVLRPLQSLRGAPAAEGKASVSASGAALVTFERVATLAELDARLRASKQPVMLDFYADWCTSCKEMEHITFADSAVVNATAAVTRLQVDVTANSEHDKALLKRYSLFGPPGILWFKAGGEEIANGRMMGYLGPQDFIAQMQRNVSSSAPAQKSL